MLGNTSGSFQLEIVNDQGKAFPVSSLFADLPSPLPDNPKDLFRWVRETTLLLGPGRFIGFTEKLRLADGNTMPPGTYSLRACYRDLSLDELVEDQKLARETPKLAVFPVWYGRVESSWVGIVVLSD